MTPQIKKLLQKEGLNPQQLAKIDRLLAKFHEKNAGGETDEEELEEEPEVLIQIPKKQPAKKPVKKQGTSGKILDNNPHQFKINNRNKQGGKKGRAAQVAGPVQATGTNLFNKMPERNSEMADVAIDKLLAKHPPTERRGGGGLVDIECRDCGNEFTVSPVLAIRNDEGDSNYVCEDCISSKRRNRRG